MSKRFSILLVVLTIVSGLIGGLISGRIFAVNPAQAVEAKQNKVLTAEELRIVDKNGKMRMILGQAKDHLDYYGLAICDNSGRVGAVMDVNESRSSFRAFGKNGNVQASMNVDEFGSGVSVFEKDGKIGAMINVDESGSIFSLSFGKGDGKAKVYIGAIKGGSVASLYGKDGKPGANIEIDEHGGQFSAFGKVDDKPRAGIGVNEYGSGSIGLWDKDGYRLK